MAIANFTNLESIADDLNDMAAQISTFKPILNKIHDETLSVLSDSVYGQLEMIACLSDYINIRLGEAAAKLSRLDKPAS